ncbi:hypothetical protein GIB67_004674 [Kingdonia uniflora]|uniref:Uncharacterized protein n=1 Tax=Kingdonia uniflora TaxID=39325 RepID=A0A7J7P565_9MAGN|nr:hypothetical protein GIB67_004674 [Kingdonia uniflora]
MMMIELHLQGKTIEDIANCLKRVALNPRIVQAIKSAHALGCDFRIVNHANVFFIETILEHYGLIRYFSEIKKNPSVIDKEGRLRILPYHDLEMSSHCSNPYPPNICKSIIIERIRESIFLMTHILFIPFIHSFSILGIFLFFILSAYHSVKLSFAFIFRIYSFIHFIRPLCIHFFPVV